MQAIAQAITKILEAIQYAIRKIKEKRRQDSRDQLDDDPEQWFRDNYGGMSDDEDDD